MDDKKEENPQKPVVIYGVVNIGCDQTGATFQTLVEAPKGAKSEETEVVEEVKDSEGDNKKEPENPQKELNFFAPKKNLQELLKQAWFAEVRTDAKYDAQWTDGFVEALMASEHGEGIARQWAVKGARNKRNQLKGYVVGLLKDEGVLKDSYDAIAAKIGITEKSRTFSRAMGDGKKQPYADWVKAYVSG